MKGRKKGKKGGKGKRLNIKWKLFCRYFTQPGAETFNNATWSYALAFGYDLENLSKEHIYDLPEGNEERKIIELSPYDRACNVCAVEGRRLLRTPQIQQEILDRMYELFGDDKAVDAEAAKVIYQNHDLSAKNTAIRARNQLKKRINDEPVLPVNAQPITQIEINISNVPQKKVVTV